MRTRRTSRALVILVAAVVALMLAEGGLVFAVFVSPSTADRLETVAASADRAWNGTKKTAGIRTKIADAFDRGYRDWLEAMWKEPQAPTPDAEFTKCVTCHDDYATKRRFTTVYMNHPLHAQEGVECRTCHVENQHPNPVRPEERVCETCHSEVREEGSCGLCHPPASLPHFYLLGASRDRVVECSVCHPRKSFQSTATERLIDTPHFDGSDRTQCLQCHQEQTCRSCHAAKHPTDWVSKHGEVVGEDPTPCYACHTGDWCTSRCHAVTSTNPFVPKPLPTSGVRP